MTKPDSGITRRALFVGILALILPVGFFGCGGGESRETGTTVTPDAAEAERQKEMAEFYKTNPPGGAR